MLEAGVWNLRGPRQVLHAPAPDDFGRVIAYFRRGTGAPLVLLHGVGLRADIWAPQVNALCESFDVIAMDMLGHGASSLPPRGAALDDFSSQVEALLDGLALDAAHLAGHSMGGLVALDFAIRHPARTVSLTALNPVYERNPEQRQAVAERAAALREDGPAPVAAATIARWFGNPAPERLAPYAIAVRAMLESVDPAGYARSYRVFASIDNISRDRLRQLAVPCAFMTGELDPNSTPQMCAALASRVQNGRCDIIPGERHMMALTSPEAVNTRLFDFLSNVARSGAVRTHDEARQT
ncbi:MAG: alpha/beta fold hydrolase [Hyphomicrobiales bacterium]|nr:alpha/beta fold hydrolase [Hyphomicrobiales bacterium]